MDAELVMASKITVPTVSGIVRSTSRDGHHHFSCPSISSLILDGLNTGLPDGSRW